jgi:Xaa-Pro aminopeptidase
MRATRPGLKEAEIVAAMDAVIVRAGCAHAYLPIVTREGEVLHDERHHRTLESGDLLLADVGAETPGGWASDVTRTWPASGKFSATQRSLYEVVLAAQRAAIAAVRPGVRYLDVHRAAGKKLLEGLIALGVFRGDLEDLYARGAAALFFPHGIGHLLGLDVHDMEDLGDRAGYAPGRQRAKEFGLRALRLDRDLVPGMVVTIEPGLYQVPSILDDAALTRVAGDRLDRKKLAAFADVRGIRIEDDVLVTETGRLVLTEAIPKTLDAVEAAVGAGAPPH